jgi:hypothetical protein
LNAPLSEIKRDNVKDFFLWAFFNTGEHDPVDGEELDEYVGERKIEPGRGSARCMRLTVDKVDMLHRSLTWYMVSFCSKIKSNLSFYSTNWVANSYPSL